MQMRPLRRRCPLAQQLKQRILAERQLTATIGIAANKLLAKIASDHQKPDGLTLIPKRRRCSSYVRCRCGRFTGWAK